MLIQTHDYLVLNIGNKPMLAKCTSAKEKEYKARLENKRTDDDKDAFVDFRLSDVMSNLGRRPKIGSVHGVKIEPLVSREPSPSKMWQDIRVYQFLDETQKAALLAEVASVTKKLRQYGLGILRCELEVRQKSGKYSGYYKYRPKADTDILCIKPEENLEGFQYVLAHESAHGVWSRMLQPKTRIAWIQMFHDYITLQEVLEEELTAILDGVTSATSIRDYLKDTPDDGPLIKDILKHIQRVHGLNKSHLELALNNSESIEIYWPTAIELSSKETAISDYSMKSPEEFFAEAFAFHICGRKIPKKIQALLDSTLSTMKR